MKQDKQLGWQTWLVWDSHLDIELLELLQVETAGGAVLEEALVPLFQLVLVKLCVLHQVLHHFRGQFAVLFPHFACRHKRKGK